MGELLAASRPMRRVKGVRPNDVIVSSHAHAHRACTTCACIILLSRAPALPTVYVIVWLAVYFLSHICILAGRPDMQRATTWPLQLSSVILQV